MYMYRDQIQIELEHTFRAIDMQMAAIDKEAQNIGTVSYAMRNADGSWVLTPLLAARAQVLNAMAMIAAK